MFEGTIDVLSGYFEPFLAITKILTAVDVWKRRVDSAKEKGQARNGDR